VVSFISLSFPFSSLLFCFRPQALEAPPLAFWECVDHLLQTPRRYPAQPFPSTQVLPLRRGRRNWLLDHRAATPTSMHNPSHKKSNCPSLGTTNSRGRFKCAKCPRYVIFNLRFRFVIFNLEIWVCSFCGGSLFAYHFK